MAKWQYTDPVHRQEMVVHRSSTQTGNGSTQVQYTDRKWQYTGPVHRQEMAVHRPSTDQTAARGRSTYYTDPLQNYVTSQSVFEVSVRKTYCDIT